MSDKKGSADKTVMSKELKRILHSLELIELNLKYAVRFIYQKQQSDNHLTEKELREFAETILDEIETLRELKKQISQLIL